MNGTTTKPVEAEGAHAGCGTEAGNNEHGPIRYRTAKEFLNPVKGERGDGGGPTRWLRVFEDGNGVLVAGLYDSPDPEQNDHWANGDPATDELDAQMAAKCIPYGDTEAMKTAILAIANSGSTQGESSRSASRFPPISSRGPSGHPGRTEPTRSSS